MTRNHNSNNYYNRDGGYRQYQKRPDDRKSDNRQQEQNPIVAKPLPADYVDAAEKVIQKVIQADVGLITTSKLRNLLSLFVDVYNTENLLTGDELQPASVNALTMARIRMLYEAGRDRVKVKKFIEAADLLPYLKDIGKSRTKMINYYHYLEALVAYHKYYEGREN
ncbi:MAG: type III-A CRISPR-associated protein Csm2 [Oscillospiraceae bacterium]|nr:type III-A CRISPR-associated protein Csm2 [Oscillospiraceae bacterium]